MSARDDLADLIEATWWAMPSPADHIWEKMADAVIAAGWRPPARIITTAEELDALPEGSMVLDRSHDVAEKHFGRLLYRETRNMPLEYLAKHYGPFTILREPGDNDE